MSYLHRQWSTLLLYQMSVLLHRFVGGQRWLILQSPLTFKSCISCNTMLWTAFPTCENYCPRLSIPMSAHSYTCARTTAIHQRFGNLIHLYAAWPKRLRCVCVCLCVCECVVLCVCVFCVCVCVCVCVCECVVLCVCVFCVCVLCVCAFAIHGILCDSDLHMDARARTPTYPPTLCH